MNLMMCDVCDDDLMLLIGDDYECMLSDDLGCVMVCDEVLVMKKIE